MKKTIKKIIASVEAVCLGAICVFVAAGTLVSCGKAGESGSEDKKAEYPAEKDSGFLIGEAIDRGITFTKVKLTSDEYEDYGVSEQVETAYTLTATITPEDATDKKVNWTAAFTTPTSAWATGKTLSEYLTITPTSDGSLTAAVSCLQAFGEEITITCTSRGNTSASASCAVNYVKRVSSVAITSPTTIVFSTTATNYTVAATPTYGVGTLTPDTFTITDGYLNKLINTTTVISNHNLSGTYYNTIAHEKLLEFTGTTFSVSTPYNAFVSNYTQSQSSEELVGGVSDKGGSSIIKAMKSVAIKPMVDPGVTYPTEAQLISAYNNSFIQNATNTSSDGKLSISYTYSYGGTEYGSNTATLNVAFNATSLTITAVSIDLSKNSIVF